MLKYTLISYRRGDPCVTLFGGGGGGGGGGRYICVLRLLLEWCLEISFPPSSLKDNSYLE